MVRRERPSARVRSGEFKERLRDMAYDASWRADGKYRPLEEIDIVLLGDILDLIRSTKWLEGSVRPWSNPQFLAAQTPLGVTLHFRKGKLKNSPYAVEQ